MTSNRPVTGPANSIECNKPEGFETALEHSCRAVPVVQPESTIAEIKTLLWNGRYDCVSHIVVCAADKFAGILRIEDVLMAEGDQMASELMDSDTPRVGPKTDREVAAWKATQHGQSALAVVRRRRPFHWSNPTA